MDIADGAKRYILDIIARILIVELYRTHRWAIFSSFFAVPPNFHIQKTFFSHCLLWPSGEFYMLIHEQHLQVFEHWGWLGLG